MTPFHPHPQQLSQLLWRHFRWHLWVGLVIWLCVVLPITLFNFLKDRDFILHTPFYAPHQAEAISNSASNYGWLAIVPTLGVLFLAIISGLLRHEILDFVSRNARTRTELVWKSMVVFELLVALVSLIPWPIAYNRFSVSMVGHQFLACFLSSLPWLIATGLASRKLAVALGLPRN